MTKTMIYVEDSAEIRVGLPLRALRLVLGGACRIAPATMSRWAERRFLRPRRFPPPSRESRWLAEADRFSVPFGAGELACWAWGEGPLVLLVHGWEGRGGQFGDLGRWLAREGFRAVTFDHPGHGESPGKSSSLVAFAEAIHAVVGVAGRPFALVAHSAGCAGSSYSLQMGLEPDRLVYISPPSELAPWARQFGAMIGLTEQVSERMRLRVEDRIGVRWRDIHGLDLMVDKTQPLLVIHDHDDREVLISHGRQLAAHWPGARMVATRGRGHRRILRAPELKAAVSQFLGLGTAAVGAPLERVS
ncbi:MAG: alpha/beta fold hydrolase [Acidobacteriota bacterium]